MNGGRWTRGTDSEDVVFDFILQPSSVFAISHLIHHPQSVCEQKVQQQKAVIETSIIRYQLSHASI